MGCLYLCLGNRVCSAQISSPWGDVLTHNSIAAYLGMIFAYASIFIMTNEYSFILFGVKYAHNAVVASHGGFEAGKTHGQSDRQHCGLYYSRVYLCPVFCFYYDVNDFANRLVIDSQSLEIGQQDRLKAEISERKREEEQMLAYQKRLLSMDVELAMAEEQERRRIAADLHDHIGQYLAISRIKLMSIRYAADPEMKTLLDEVLGHDQGDEQGNPDVNHGTKPLDPVRAWASSSIGLARRTYCRPPGAGCGIQMG